MVQALKNLLDKFEAGQATEDEEEFLWDTYTELRAMFTPTEIFL